MAQKKTAKRKMVERMLQDLRADPVAVDHRLDGDEDIYPPMVAAFVRAYELPDRIVVVAAAPARITPDDAAPLYTTNTRRFLVTEIEADDYGWRVKIPGGEVMFSRVFPGESKRTDELVAEFRAAPKAVGVALNYVTEIIEDERATELTP